MNFKFFTQSVTFSFTLAVVVVVAMIVGHANASMGYGGGGAAPSGFGVGAHEHQHMALDPAGNFHLYWMKNAAQEEITFKVEVKTRGWVGLGLSPNGGMINSDIVIGWVEDGGGIHFHDRYATGETLPLIDASQDWKLLEGSENGTHTTLVFSRPYRSCDDKFDRDILDGLMRIIWAYGDEDPLDKDRINMHQLSKRGSKSIRLLMETVAPTDAELEPDVETWDILAKNSRVPTKETTYFCTLHKSPFREKRHIVKYDVVVQPGNEQHVHHMVLFRCQHPNPAKLEAFTRSQDHECIPGLNNMPPDLLNCRSFYIIWTVGGGPFYFPKEAGLGIGGGEDANSDYYMLEIHYDNKAGRRNVIDNSGLRLFTTKTLRKYDADNYVMGSAEDYRILLPPRQPELVVVGHCSHECHDDVMAKEGITVMSIMVHAHLLARRIKARHFRGNVELEPLVDEKYYDFNYQDYWHFPVPRKIMPGDQVTVECYYNTSELNTTTLGGFQTSEEMCHVFIPYYPRMKSDRSCFSGLSPTTIATLAGIDELAPIIPEVDPVIVSPVAHKGKNITTYLQEKDDWDDDLITNSLHLLRYAPRQTMCYYRATDNIKVTKHMVGYPKGLKEYVETRTCTAKYGAALDGGSSWGTGGVVALISIVVLVLVLALVGCRCVSRRRRSHSDTSFTRVSH